MHLVDAVTIWGVLAAVVFTVFSASATIPFDKGIRSLLF